MADAGNMSGFNRAWKTQGPDRAASKVPRVHRVPAATGRRACAWRTGFTQLVDGKKGLGLPSFKESLLTKVLCIVEPERFLPVLKYTAATEGKKEIAKLVFDLDLPPAEKSA